MLGELAVQRRLDRADRLAQAHSDGHLAFSFTRRSAVKTRSPDGPNGRDTGHLRQRPAA
jgi:hypothetical protein